MHVVIAHLISVVLLRVLLLENTLYLSGKVAVCSEIVYSRIINRIWKNNCLKYEKGDVLFAHLLACYREYGF